MNRIVYLIPTNPCNLPNLPNPSNLSNLPNHSNHSLRTLFAILSIFTSSLNAQFAPAAGKIGSTAIKADSSCFINWAKSCEINRALAQINLADSGYATVGNATSAIGPAKTNGIVSLGDGGSAILYFNPPIADFDGYDFAVFENAFNDSFLELAHVEVSNDKINWLRFPSVSLSTTKTQTEPFGFTNPEKIHNLAGKYRMPYGTPFDLSDLKDSSQYEHTFQYVRVVDVVGSIDSNLGSKDSKGNMINDPWPTPFASSGFDLDAVGVINQAPQMNAHSIDKQDIYFQSETRALHFPTASNTDISLFSLEGKLVFKTEQKQLQISIPTNIADGVYIVKLNNLSFKINLH